MATKTISIDLEAYGKLDNARQNPRESFSKVIHRAEWPEKKKKTLGAYFDAVKNAPPLDDRTLRELDEVLASDQPPKDKWEEAGRLEIGAKS